MDQIPPEINYCLLDGSKMLEELSVAQELNPDHSCLYEGDSEKFLHAVAPWLFSFEVGTEFATWFRENGDQQDWGVFFASSAEPVDIYRHLRKFLIIKNDEGKELYFRYYDPRVLRVFLPTCSREQLLAIFGPIDSFVAQDESGSLLQFRHQNGKLLVDGMVAKPADEQAELDQTSKMDSSMTDEDRKDELTDGPGWDFGY